MEEQWQIVWQTANHADSEGATGYLHHRASNMDRGTERHAETCNFITYSVSSFVVASYFLTQILCELAPLAWMLEVGSEASFLSSLEAVLLLRRLRLA